MRHDHAPDIAHARHAPEGTRARPVAWVLGGIMMLTVVTGFLVWVLYPSSRTPADPPRPLSDRSVSSLGGAAHWQNPPADLARARAEFRARLDGYGWADSARTHARIPIARAMALLAARGAMMPATMTRAPLDTTRPDTLRVRP